MIIKCSLFIISIIFIIYRYGILVGKLIGEKNLNNIIIYGVLVLFASNQIVLTPCILFHTSFKTCCILIGIMTILLITLSYIIKGKLIEHKIKIKNKVITGVMIILVIFQMITSTIIFTENADDSFYVSLAISSIDSKNVYWEEPSMGYNSNHSLLTPLEKIPSYELSIAVYSKIFGITPAIIFHTLIPLIFIGISYLSYYYLARTILSKNNSKIFIIILSIIMMFTSFSTKFRTGCLLYKMWQGKALFLNISLNIIIASLLRLSKKTNKKDMIILFLANLSAVHLSATSIFIVSFVYLAFGILKLVKLKIKDILYFVITFMPILIYAIILIILMKLYPVKTIVPLEEVSIKQALSYYGSKTYLILYLISVIIIGIIGNKQAKKYFVLIQIINLLTIWNPLFANLIAKYLTSSATFWRVFWLLPIETSIAYAITEILNKEKTLKTKMITLSICITILVVNGKFAYNKPIAENLEKIPQYVIDQTNYILNSENKNTDITVLAPPEPLHSCTIRQLTSKIKLIYSRSLYRDKIRNKEEESLRAELEKIYIEVPQYTEQEFNNKLIQCGVDWIIINEQNESLLEYIDKTIMTKENSIGGYVLYRNENNSKYTN